MTKHIGHCGSWRRTGCKHHLHEPFKVSSQLTVIILGPEFLRIFTIVSSKLSVFFILDWICSFPRICNHFCHKQSDSKRKNVCILSLIRDSLVKNFWSHIHWSSKPCIRVAILLSSWKWKSISQINYLNPKILLCDHQILWLYVAMCYSRLMKLMDSFPNLMEHVPQKWVRLILTLI